MAYVLARDERYDLAFPWYEKAANLGIADAQNNVGIFYAEGRGVEQVL